MSQEVAKTYDLSLVVPCYNEVDNIPLFLKTATECFESTGVSLEIVFVNDGSQDGTAALLRQVVAKARGTQAVQAINFSRNFGKESALYAGMEAARGNVICLIDADMQQTPADALKMYRILMENPDYDCVAACQVERKEGFVLKLFKRAFYRTFNGMADDISIPANVSDFRVFRRPVRDALLSLPEVERFSKGLFAWIGFNTYEMPYQAEERASGRSKWSFRKLMGYAMSGIFGFTTWPLKVAIWFGLACAVAAGIYLISVLVEFLLYGATTPGFPTLACLILLFGGLQLTVLGVIGEYLGRDYIENKRRPIYLAKEKLDSTQE